MHARTGTRTHTHARGGGDSGCAIQILIMRWPISSDIGLHTWETSQSPGRRGELERKTTRNRQHTHTLRYKCQFNIAETCSRWSYVCIYGIIACCTGQTQWTNTSHLPTRTVCMLWPKGNCRLISDCQWRQVYFLEISSDIFQIFMFMTHSHIFVLFTLWFVKKN